MAKVKGKHTCTISAVESKLNIGDIVVKVGRPDRRGKIIQFVPIDRALILFGDNDYVEVPIARIEKAP